MVQAEGETVLFSVETKTVNGQILYENTSLPLLPGDTVYTLLDRVDTEESTITVVKDGEMISAISGFDSGGVYGSQSGWMVSVNNDSSTWPLPPLQNGDRVRWCYTVKDYGSDIILMDLIEELQDKTALAEIKLLEPDPFPGDDGTKLTALTTAYNNAQNQLAEIDSKAPEGNYKAYLDSVVVSGPESQMQIMTDLIKKLDCALLGEAYVPVTGALIESVGDPSEYRDDSPYRFQAVLEPANATNQTVFWRVTPITGSGIIDDQGNFYPLSTGQVTVEVLHSDKDDGQTPLDTKTINIVHIPTAAEIVQTAKENVVSYYKTDQEGVLEDWWELVAIYAAGENLEDYILPLKPQTATWPTDYAGLLFGELAKGRKQAEWALELADKQTDQGHFGITYPNQQAWAILTLDRMETVYNTDLALSYLLSYQLPDGGFGYSTSDPAGDPDLSAMVALALAPHAASNEQVATALEELKNFFINSQTPTGGYVSWGSENAATIATVIMGLTAMGENPAEFAHPVSNKTPVDALLAYQLDNGAFKHNATDTTANAFATKQAAIALMDLGSGVSTLGTLIQNNQEYLIASVSIHSANAYPVQEQVTVPYNATFEVAANKAWEKAVNGTEFIPANYTFVTNGIQELSTTQLTVAENTLSLMENTLTLIAAFDREEVSAAQKEAITLTLTGTPVGGGDNLPIANATITVNGQDYSGYPNKTNSDGKITLSFWESGSFTISAKSPETEVISKPVCTVSVATGTPYTRTVLVRVEGSGETIAYQKNLTLSCDGQKVLSAMDALKETLDTIPYVISGSYISSIASENAGHFGEDYDGWMYLINGQQPMVGADRQEISDGDELLFYYGGMSSTWYPLIQKDIQPDGSLHITFTAMVTEYDAYWNPVVSQKAITGATVMWDDSLYTTDDMGKVEIPSEQRTPGYHTLQISKYSLGGLPLVIRLAPDYTVLVEEQVTLTAQNPTADLTGVSYEVPIRVIIGELVQNPSLKLSSNVELPEISTEGGVSALWIAPNTIVTGESGWNGIFSLPQTKTVSLSEKTVYSAIEVGSGSNDLSFSRPVRIKIPGAAGKSIGAIDKNGALSEITTYLTFDTIEAAESCLSPASPYAMRISGDDVVIWTRTGAIFTAYTQIIPPPPQPDCVILSVYGYGGEVLLSPLQVVLQDGDTPFSILLRESGLLVEADGAYVSRIGSYGEFDYGENSGWMYQVDGVAPSSTAADAYFLENDQIVSWRYTADLGADIGSDYMSPIIEEAVTLRTERGIMTAEVAATIVKTADNTISAAIDQELIDHAINRAIEAKTDQDQQLGVLAVLDETKSDSKIRVSLEKEAFYTLKNNNIAYLTIESQGAKIKLDQKTITALYNQSVGQTIFSIDPSTKTQELGQFEITISTGDNQVQSLTKENILLALAHSLDSMETSGSMAIFRLEDGKKHPILNSKYEDGWMLFEMKEGGMYQITSQSAPFFDTQSHWGSDNVNFLYGRELVSGKSPEFFAPDDSLTRAEFLKILYGICDMEQKEEAVGETGFADILPSDWYAPYVVWGAKEGIVLGIGDGKFAPNEAITREQVALILEKAAAVFERELIQTSIEHEDFVDRSDISTWARDAVAHMKNAGIILGRENNQFNPLDTTTRAEGAAMLRRFIENPLLLD
jgi:hypothetical protein